VNILVWIVVSGFASSAVGVLFGLPSLRIKGFYLVVATLAAQFFLQWAFARVPWLYNYNDSGAIEVSTQTLFGVPVTGPTATPATRYLVALAIVSAMAWVASNIVHGRIGRMWMAVRDMDIAAELIGIRLLRAKLLAFAVSSFYIGVAGVRHRPVVPASVHDHNRRPRFDRRRLFRGGDHRPVADRLARDAGRARP
jgi:branched-chain amino acid transport system permease protein